MGEGRDEDRVKVLEGASSVFLQNGKGGKERRRERGVLVGRVLHVPKRMEGGVLGEEVFVLTGLWFDDKEACGSVNGALVHKIKVQMM